MNPLILFAILAVLSLAISIFLLSKYEVDASIFFGVVFLVCIVAFGIDAYRAATNETYWDAFIAEYESTKNILETYPQYDYGNTKEVTGQVFAINHTIAENKAKWNKTWFKPFYSQKVAELEPLKFPTPVKNYE